MSDILKEYDDKLKDFKELKHRLSFLIETILNDSNFTIHKIESRLKERISLEEKIQRKQFKYRSLHDITDVIGLRIITVFEEDINNVCQIIEKEFQIDSENSVDKRIIDYDKFGYQSVHYIAYLNSERIKLNEYSKYENYSFEIQIRSILQHAWADIQHDFGYKGVEIPIEHKRAFSRVSALLEIADKEFNQLRKNITDYKISIKSKVKEFDNKIRIDKISLEEFLLENDVIKVLDKQICKVSGRTFKPEPRITEDYIKILLFCNIMTLNELFEKLKENSSKIIEFSKNWTQIAKTSGFFRSGISILYLGYVLVADKNDSELANNFVKIRISKDTDYYVNLMFETMKKVTAGNKM